MEYKYNFSHNTPNQFEINNSSISLTIFNENNEIIHQTNNNANTKAKIIKLNNYRYAAIKPLKNKSIKLNEFIQSHSHHELSDYSFEIILKKIDGIDSSAEEIISPVLFY